MKRKNKCHDCPYRETRREICKACRLDESTDGETIRRKFAKLRNQKRAGE